MSTIDHLKNNQVFNHQGRVMSLTKTHLKIPSTPCQVAKLEDYVKGIMQTCCIKEGLYANILISLTEAVNNAIIHGNKKDEKKHVHINCIHNKESIVLSIKDEGSGFNMLEVKNPLSPERRAECGGRGVLIMNELCDQVQYQKNGSVVEIHFP